MSTLEELTPAQRAHRVRCIAALHAKAAENEVNAYIAEAEHQDGYAYWDMFASPDESVVDFLLYQENK
jgi:hypothetical protein